MTKMVMIFILYSFSTCVDLLLTSVVTMADAQLIVKTESQMPTLTSTKLSEKTVHLSDKTKVTAHPGDKWKAGYMTISRASQVKSGWRNVHISKKSCEKLTPHLRKFLDALEFKIQHHLMLTKKQHLLTTRFIREGKEPLHYVSLLHPVKEADTIKEDDEMNHAKTINLSADEFDKFVIAFGGLAEVVYSKSSTSDNDESYEFEGFRWTHKNSGTRSSKIFLTLEQCEKDSSMHYFHVNGFQGQPMEYDYQACYDYMKVPVERPIKLELIEHLAYASLLQDLKLINVDTEVNPPDEKVVNQAIDRFDHSTFKVLAKKVMMKLNYKNVYLTGELVDIFVYMNGIEKVKTCIVKHLMPVSGKMFTRLLDYCFDVVYGEMNKE